MPRRLLTALAGLVLAVVLAACLPRTDATSPSAPAGAAAVAEHVPAGTLDATTARTTLAGLPVAAPGPLTGYSRDCGNGAGCVFGQPWKDTDGDGCDQRSQVLARDLVNVVRKPGRCAVTSGTLHDPYTGQDITSVTKIQIDHVVPLAEMWRSGAAAWTVEARTQAANRLGNLLAVNGTTNQQKGDKTPDKWLPPAAAFHCAYARIYITTKTDLRLAVTRAEQTALEKALATCP